LNSNIHDNEKQSKTYSSGYQKCKEIISERKKQNPLSQVFPSLPQKKYDIIYADPPWDYGGKSQFDKTSKSKSEIDLSKNIFVSAANLQYPTMKTSLLKQIPIHEISKDDCLLFMWVTNPHLAQGIELGKAWGFEYKTVGFVWDKMIHNPGQYTMSYCELCLIFKRGKIPNPRGSRNIKQLIRTPRMEHSRKPLEILENINLMFPTQDKIELFARHKPMNWDVWGLDVLTNQDELNGLKSQT